mmetsp:Transcript_74111/g.162195  ORF Transcript_74111/g.162195 Transcript_74111/m.162195 type:complete len:628 (-) Transcript_74111:21-1904(-)
MSDPNKSRRLTRVLHRGSVSTKGLAKIAKELGATDVTRRKLRSAQTEEYLAVAHEVEVVLQEGGVMKIPCCDLGKLMSKMVAVSAQFQMLLLEALQRCPCTQAKPWNLIISFDEATPGNVLRPQTHRKLWVMSAAISELAGSLHHERLWLSPLIVRHDLTMAVAGGFSSILRVYLEHALRGPSGLEVAGVGLEWQGNLHPFFFKLGAVLADGEARRAAFQWRGAAAIRPCILCANLVKKGSGIAPMSARFVEPSCADISKFEAQTTEELVEVAKAICTLNDRVSEGLCTKARLKNLMLASGLSCCRQGLLLSNTLDGIDWLGILRYDPMRTFFQDGCLMVELNSSWQRLMSLVPGSPELLKTFILEWSYPKAHDVKSKNLAELVGRHEFRAGASELVSLFPLYLQFYEETLPNTPELMSLKAAAETAALLLQTKRGMIDPLRASERMATSHSQHLTTTSALYGGDTVKPKHHWGFHVISQVARDKWVWDTFVTERLHRRVKDLANHVDSLPRLEQSVCASLVVHQLNCLEDGFQLSGLQGAKRQVLLLRSGLKIAVGDFVSRNSELGCVPKLSLDVLFVESFRLAARKSSRCAVWSSMGSLSEWLPQGMWPVVAWKHVPEGVAILSR